MYVVIIIDCRAAFSEEIIAGRCRYSPKTSRKVDHALRQRQGLSRATILVEIPPFFRTYSSQTTQATHL